MSDFSIQDAIGQKLLDKSGIFIIHKVTRAGGTITLTKVGSASEKKIVILEPNKKIITEINRIMNELFNNKIKIAIILPNEDLCQKLKKLPGLKFQLKETCWNCEYNNPESCPFQKILDEDYDVYLLTYDKLRVLQNSEAEESKKLLNKLCNCHIFILDEFTRAILLSIFNLTVREIDQNGNVSDLREQLKDLRQESEKTQSTFELILWSTIDHFLDQCEKITKDGLYSNELIKISSEQDNRKAFAISWRLITQLEEAGYSTELLQDLTLLAFSEKFNLTIENGKYVASPVLEDALGYLRDFCKSLEDNKTVFIIDSCLPTINYEEIFQQQINHSIWGERGDPLQTNSQQLLICDTAHWGSDNFLRDRKLKEKVRMFLKHLVLKFSAKNIIVTATNKKIINVVSHWNLPKSLRITWYRSDLMRGVSIENRRVLVCIGGPYLPKKAYMREAESFEFKELVTDLGEATEEKNNFEISRMLKVLDTKSELINAVGRPKDPRGRDRSVVFLFGMQKYEVTAMLKQTGQYAVSIPHVVGPVKKGGFMKDGAIIAELWMNNDIQELTSKNVNDLPIISRILRLEKKPRLRASEVIPRQTKLIIKVAKRNRQLLKHYNIRLRKIQGGYVFEK
jgi:hypothetical protein